MSKKSFDSASSAISFLDGFINDNSGKIRKIVFSKPRAKDIIKSQITHILISGKEVWQVETFTKDNKVLHRNVAPESLSGAISSLAVNEYRSTNIIMTNAGAELMVSENGKSTLLIRGDIGNEPSVGAVSAEKNYILDARKCVSFLEPLGICDGNGRVYDKKQSKYRQINRFTELLDDVYAKLPSEGELNVCDLCCGKSYLSFAVYYYLTSIKGRIVRMYGVDLKKDVIEFCSGLAERLGFEGMTFECGDVLNFNAVNRPDLVISLHACDIATDYVLAYAIRHKAGLILSTPCCHHEVFNQLSFPKNNTLKPEKEISVPDLSFLSDNSILKSKLSDALTDSLRCLRLEAEGYKTEAVELIDPEETPKNVMIRAVYAGRKNAKALKDYYQAQKFFGLETTLSKLLENAE